MLSLVWMAMSGLMLNTNILSYESKRTKEDIY
jgi:hypothetical protein